MKNLTNQIRKLGALWTGLQAKLEQSKWGKYLRPFRGGGIIALILLLLMIHLGIGWNRTAAFEPLDWLNASVIYKATIRRDPLGVPRIHGETDADVAFGAAFAQASDALEDVEYMLRLHRAQMGLKQGLDGVTSDFLIHMLRSMEIAEQHWDDLPEHVQKVLTAYADGLNYYAFENQGLVDKTLYPVTGKDLMTGLHFQQIMFYGLAETIRRATEGRIAELTLPQTEGSNAIAISPSRGWGTTQLLINSHQPLDGPLSWYEMGLHSEEGWQIHGGTFPSSPFIYLGTTQNLGWGATVNKPGLVQFYKLRLHEDDPRRYYFNGSWWDMEIKEINLPFKLFANFYWSTTRTLEYSKHGPVFRTEDGAWAMRYAGADEYRHAEQWLRMNKATQRDEWMEAVRIRALPSLNLVYADAEGNISYIYNARMRLVPTDALDEEGFLPGDSSKYLELPLLPFDRMPIVENPRSGWVVSTNQTPFYVTGPQDNLRHEDFPAGLPIETTVNNRALRAVELLSRSGPVTADRLAEIKYDKTYSDRYNYLDWLEGLRDEDFEPGTRLLEDIQRELLQWDLTVGAENPYAALGICMVEASRRHEQQDTTFRLKEEMKDCGEPLLEHFDTLIPPWGEVLRLQRGEQSWPLGGAPDMLRAMYYRSGEDGTQTAVAGDGLTILAEWDRRGKLHLRTIHQYGSSRNPESVNYSNQAPMFSEEQFRETYAYDDPPPVSETLRVPY